MSQASKVYEQKVKKKGYWEFKGLYEFCYLWFKDRDYKLEEKEYTEKDTGKKEVQIKWEAKKKVSDYFQNKIVLKWHILQLEDVEIERGGKKIKTNKGDLKLDLKVDLISDYEGRWEDKAFNKFLRGLYDKFVIKTTTDEYEERLKESALKFVADAKAFLELDGR
jgi:hypothetical protein